MIIAPASPRVATSLAKARESRKRAIAFLNQAPERLREAQAGGANVARRPRSGGLLGT